MTQPAPRPAQSFHNAVAHLVEGYGLVLHELEARLALAEAERVATRQQLAQAQASLKTAQELAQAQREHIDALRGRIDQLTSLGAVDDRRDLLVALVAAADALDDLADEDGDELTPSEVHAFARKAFFAAHAVVEAVRAREPGGDTRVSPPGDQATE